MEKPADYVRRAKEKLGNGAMSDREFGQRLGGFASSTISSARYGNMSDAIAILIAQVLGIDAGEVLMVARIEREKDEQVRAALSSWASKTLAAMSLAAAASGATAAGGDVAASPAQVSSAPVCIM